MKITDFTFASTLTAIWFATVAALAGWGPAGASAPSSSPQFRLDPVVISGTAPAAAPRTPT